MTNAAHMPPRVAFSGIADPFWTAGAHYYINLFQALETLPDERRPRIVLLKTSEDINVYDGYRAYVDEFLEISDEKEPAPRFPDFWERQAIRVKRRLNLVQPQPPKPNRLETFLRANRIDAVFATWKEFGADFKLPALTWIPDFQHIYFPEWFPKREADWRREWLFPMIAANVSRETHLFKGFLHAAQIGHSIIDNHDFLHGVSLLNYRGLSATCPYARVLCHLLVPRRCLGTRKRS